MNSTGYNFTTIKNCEIVEGNSSGTVKHAINYYMANNGTIHNNTIRTIAVGSYCLEVYWGGSNQILDTTKSESRVCRC